MRNRLPSGHFFNSHVVMMSRGIQKSLIGKMPDIPPSEGRK